MQNKEVIFAASTQIAEVQLLLLRSSQHQSTAVDSQHIIPGYMEMTDLSKFSEMVEFNPMLLKPVQEYRETQTPKKSMRVAFLYF